MQVRSSGDKGAVIRAALPFKERFINPAMNIVSSLFQKRKVV